MLLTGPFGGLTDDVREFLLCLADEAVDRGRPRPGRLAPGLAGPEPPASLAGASLN